MVLTKGKAKLTLDAQKNRKVKLTLDGTDKKGPTKRKVQLTRDDTDKKKDRQRGS